jgi:hypothetical protein
MHETAPDGKKYNKMKQDILTIEKKWCEKQEFKIVRRCQQM